MKKISTINFKYLRNQELLGFLQQLHGRFAHMPEVTSKKPWLKFDETLVEYEQCLHSGGGFNYKVVKTADKALDQSWSSFKAQIRVMSIHPDPAVKASASLILEIFKTNPTHLPYDDAMAVMKNQLKELDSLPQSHFETTCSAAWLADLHQKFDQFVEIKKNFISENASSRNNKIRKLRDHLNYAYTRLTELLMALSELSEDESLLAQIDSLNAQIDAKKLAMKQRSGRKQNEEADQATAPAAAEPQETKPETAAPAAAEPICSVCNAELSRGE